MILNFVAKIMITVGLLAVSIDCSNMASDFIVEYIYEKEIVAELLACETAGVLSMDWSVRCEKQLKTE